MTPGSFALQLLVLGAVAVSVRAGTVVRSIAEAEAAQQHAAERFRTATSTAIEANVKSVTTSAETVPVVVAQGVQDFFKSPSPPPPPFTDTQFGIDMFDAAAAGDFRKGGQVLNFGAGHMKSVGYHKVETADGMYKQQGQAMKAGIDFAFVSPPSPPASPTAAAAMQHRNKALAQSHLANEQLVEAAEAAVVASADLFAAKIASAASMAKDPPPAPSPVPPSAPLPPPPPEPDADAEAGFWFLHADAAATSDHSYVAATYFSALGCGAVAIVGAAAALHWKAIRRANKGMAESADPTASML